MRFLLDSNIILEVLLGQKREKEVRKLFELIPQSEFYISDFALHSIGVILYSESDQEGFNKFFQDMVLEGPLVVLDLAENEIQDLKQYADKYQLDFDDAYQYGVAQKLDLSLLTFDSDFDQVPVDSNTPAEILEKTDKPD